MSISMRGLFSSRLVATWPRAAFILLIAMASSVISTNANRISVLEASVASRDSILPAQRTADLIVKISQTLTTDEVQTSRLDGIDARVTRMSNLIVALLSETAALKAKAGAAAEAHEQHAPAPPLPN